MDFKLKKLIEKYDVLGPRYTSYPPIPCWENPPSIKDWFAEIAKYKKEISLYIHIPYCHSICSYCGCNRQKIERLDEVDRYIGGVLTEIEIYKENIGHMQIEAIHLGGGTPTVLSIAQMDMMLANLLKNNSHSIIGSLEADPRVTSIEQLRLLYSYGFGRISFGVQDLVEKIQHKVNRVQSFEMIDYLVNHARKIGYSSINFDLIYGLPGQSLESIKESMSMVLKLRPDTVAYYSFAFVPSFAPNQNKIKVEELPSGIFKRELFELGRNLLLEGGYFELGMDHFALPNSPLMNAYNAKKIFRSFMGYTEKITSTLVGLGASAISHSPSFFLQNEKGIDTYLNLLKQKKIPANKGHTNTAQDILVSDVIQELMCQGHTCIENVKKEKLSELLYDGLITIEDNLLKVTILGRAFLRNIAMAFDYRLKSDSEIKFSRTI